jgi:translocation and assembly module TamB
MSLEGDSQTVQFDLADKRAGLGARASITSDRARIALQGVQVRAGAGRIELNGTFARDARRTYDVHAALTDFDPRLLMAPPKTSPAKGFQGVALQEARVSGTLAVAGAFAPEFTTLLRFTLGNSVYGGYPLSGSGRLQVAGARLLPSDAVLSIAGNDVELHGSFGARGDRLRFHLAAPQLDRLGYGLAGKIVADGDLTGSLAQPEVTLSYAAQGVALGAMRVGSASGRASMHAGATGAIEFTTEVRDLHTSLADLATVSARVSGTRAKHSFDLSGKGAIHGRPIDLTLAATGGLADTPAGPRWEGTVTRLENRGMPALALKTPLVIKAARESLTLGATQVLLEGAQLDLKSFAYDHGALRSGGTATNLSLGRLLTLREALTGTPLPVRSDLVLAGDWNFELARTASGSLQFNRVSGDISVDAGQGSFVPLGITAFGGSASVEGGKRLAAKLHAEANRVGTADANVGVPLTPDASRGGLLGVAADAPLAGALSADVPSLTTTGALLGPRYLLEGSLALKVAVAGTMASPAVSGSLTGDSLSATLVDQGLQLKDGVVRVALSDNLVDFQHVEFHGGDGTLRAKGQIRLDRAEPDLTAQIVADKLELFAAPDRRLSLSGSATVANAGEAGGLDINGKFRVDQALFDMPEQPAPSLSDDVVIVRDNGFVRETPPQQEAADRPASRFAPRTDIEIDLGEKFRFHGRGADLGLLGTVTVLTAPGKRLMANGNVRVTEGSTYTTFGRKLAIENGYFTFNGPATNPGINILAMRRNQDVEAGVQVTGTVNAPVAKLVSEPNVSDDEKLSWLLFGHGTDQGINPGQQSTMTTALALLGSATGKRVAQTIGLDEFSVGRSDVGLTDPQVVLISKAITERLVLGYEQGLESSNNAFKATINLSRFWSILVYGGTFQGVDISFIRRFDSF